MYQEICEDGFPYDLTVHRRLAGTIRLRPPSRTAHLPLVSAGLWASVSLRPLQVSLLFGGPYLRAKVSHVPANAGGERASGL